MAMKPKAAVYLENWFPRPDGLVMREGYTNHVTAIPDPVERIHVYSKVTGGDELFATTASGVYDVTVAGAAGAAEIALTEGKTIATSISTGAGNYLMVVNGVDDLVQYDGTTWTAVPTFTGPVNTDRYKYVELYRQRLFFVVRNSLELEYLPVNSISGTPTNYPMGAIFRLGGYIVAIATWTIDAGSGPEDRLAVFTNKGQVAVFAGADPATWSFQGVYFIGEPIGTKPLLTYGGDILVITEAGVRPLSSVVQAASIDRTQTTTQMIQPILTRLAATYGAEEGWELVSHPLAPFLLLNIPSTPLTKQAVMHAQTGAWSFFTGMQALCFARKNTELYFGTTNSVCRITGVSDNGSNIVSRMVQAYSQMGYPRNKQIKLLKPYFKSANSFEYDIGIASDLVDPTEFATITLNGGTPALWGSGIWGTSLWSGIDNNIQDWQTVPDIYSHWKAVCIVVTSNGASVEYFGSDILFQTGGTF